MNSYIENIKFYVEGVLLLGVAMVGVVGNLAFIVIFYNYPRKLNTFHR